MPSAGPGYGPPRPFPPYLGRSRAHARAVGGLAPVAVAIPFAWLTPALNWAVDRVYTTAAVTGADGGAGRAASAESVDEYGENNFTANLATLSTADPINLAHFTIAFFAPGAGEVPRMRAATMAFVLNSRTADEQAVILAASLPGTRITLTGAPTDLPEGGTEQVIEGVAHTHAEGPRTVAWITAPVLGLTPGVSGPWFLLGSSSLSGTDYMAY